MRPPTPPAVVAQPRRPDRQVSVSIRGSESVRIHSWRWRQDLNPRRSYPHALSSSAAGGSDRCASTPALARIVRSRPSLQLRRLRAGCRVRHAAEVVPAVEVNSHHADRTAAAPRAQLTVQGIAHRRIGRPPRHPLECCDGSFGGVLLTYIWHSNPCFPVLRSSYEHHDDPGRHRAEQGRR
jgi:hypothetical protein